MSYATRAFRICIATVLTVAAFGLTTAIASAAPVDPALPGPAATAEYDGSARGEVPTVAPASATGGDGFDWGDAGIGAAGAFALTMIGFGAVIVLGRRHDAERHGVAV